MKRTDTTVRSGPADSSKPSVWKYETPEVFDSAKKTPAVVSVVKGKNRFNFDFKLDGSSYTINGENFPVK